MRQREQTASQAKNDQCEEQKLSTAQIRTLLRDCHCRVIGPNDISNRAERNVLAALLQTYRKTPDVTLLCEPSLAHSTHRPPDFVVQHDQLGLHVIEVKGHALKQVTGVHAGEFQMNERGRQYLRTPFKQVRAAMFDIKNAVEKSLGNHTIIPFLYWVAFPNIERTTWRAKWGPDAFEPPELLFKEDLEPSRLGKIMEQASRAVLTKFRLRQCPPEQLQHIARAFGDTSILYDEERVVMTKPDGTLGEFYEERAFDDKRLSPEQQKLAAQDWRGGPHLCRGVAGSGKTVVLATHLARLVERWRKESQQSELFEPPQKPRRVLSVCFNRTLVPFIRRKICSAFAQRTGSPELPAGQVTITHMNELMWQLHQKGLWPYQKIDGQTKGDSARRAKTYLEAIRKRHGSALLHALQYDAIYVDEGQDFHEDEFRILANLCKRQAPDQQPDLFVFYDDAQNLYGRARPTWEKLGLRMTGRAHVMKECFRNTRQIVEPAFNVLLGSHAPPKTTVHTRTFADTNYLEKEGVLAQSNNVWHTEFAKRVGQQPELYVAETPGGEAKAIVAKLAWLIDKEKVRPEDILVIGIERDRLRQLADFITTRLQGLTLFLPFEPHNKDDYLTKKGHVTISTVHSSKGYDAYCVLFLSATTAFDDDTDSRAAFYVACTRAREHLYLFTHTKTGLTNEFSRTLTNPTK